MVDVDNELASITHHKAGNLQTTANSRADESDFYSDEESSEYAFALLESQLHAESDSASSRSSNPIEDTGPPITAGSISKSEARLSEEKDQEPEVLDFELMEIDADIFNAAMKESTLERENAKLWRMIRTLEKDAKLAYPLFMAGVTIRKRYLNVIKRGTSSQPGQGIVDDEAIREGNRIAHNANILADMALLDFLEDKADPYREVVTSIYNDIWSPQRIPGWEDISWDDRNAELISMQGTIRANRMPELLFNPELSQLAKRVKDIAATVQNDQHLFLCAAKREKINADAGVNDLVSKLQDLFKRDAAVKRHRRRTVLWAGEVRILVLWSLEVYVDFMLASI